MGKTTRMLRKQNNVFEEQLSKQNQDVMTDIVVYLRYADISEMNQELIRVDIGQMLFDAQKRGESSQKVIGMDYKQFCDDILENVEHETGKEKVVRILMTTMLCATMILPILMLYGALNNIVMKQNWWSMQLTLGQVISYTGIALWATGFVQYISRHSFEVETRIQKTKLFFLLFVPLILVIVCVVCLKQVLVTTNIFLYMVLFVIAAATYWTFDRLEG